MPVKLIILINFVISKIDSKTTAMKDISIKNIPKDSIYKEFVVIGEFFFSSNI